MGDYTLLQGEFFIRYEDLPRQGPEPDGDTVKFLPNNPDLVYDLPRLSGVGPKMNSRGISVRLEAIDALETHFPYKKHMTHQEPQGGKAARDELLRLLGFTNVVYFDDLPDKVESASHDSLPGSVLSNGIDANGRMIGFVYKRGADLGEDGSTVQVDTALLDQSLNTALLADGHVYPAFYGTLPAPLREHLAAKSREAREAGKGIWPRSTADPNHAANGVNAKTLQDLVIWPKLFRRLVPFFATGNTSLDDFDDWLRKDRVNRDDELFFPDSSTRGNLHDVVTAAGSSIQLTVWPDEFVIKPDPAPAA